MKCNLFFANLLCRWGGECGDLGTNDVWTIYSDSWLPKEKQEWYFSQSWWYHWCHWKKRVWWDARKVIHFSCDLKDQVPFAECWSREVEILLSSVPWCLFIFSTISRTSNFCRRSQEPMIDPCDLIITSKDLACCVATALRNAGSATPCLRM